MNNLNWDDYFMSLAFLISQKSKDPSTKIGAIIVDKNHRCISFGFNGAPHGIDDSKVPYHSKDKYGWICHAESNALTFAKQDLEGCTLYVTGKVCKDCMKTVCQTGIMKIIAGPVQPKMVDEENYNISKLLAKERGIEIIDYDDKDTIIFTLINTIEYIKQRCNITK